MNNYAYVTVLTNIKYIPGVRALARSLKDTKSKYPLYLLIPEDKEDILLGLSENDKRLIGEDNIIKQPNVMVPSTVEYNDSYWRYTFFKLQSMRCTQFEKIILLDSDMLIQNNIDNLFACAHYSAAVAGHTRMNKWVQLNSGLMVMEPSNDLADKLISLIPHTVKKREAEGRDSGDQDVFQEAFPRWEDNKELCLKENYNCFYSDVSYVVKAYKCRVSDISVIHFIGQQKPWMYSKIDELKIVLKNYIRNPLIAGEQTKILFKYIKYTKDIENKKEI